jgi:hypothetical protein
VTQNDQEGDDWFGKIKSITRSIERIGAQMKKKIEAVE